MWNCFSFAVSRMRFGLLNDCGMGVTSIKESLLGEKYSNLYQTGHYADFFVEEGCSNMIIDSGSISCEADRCVYFKQASH